MSKKTLADEWHAINDRVIEIQRERDTARAELAKALNDLQAVINGAIVKERVDCIEAINRAAFESIYHGLDYHYGYVQGIRDAIGAIRAREARDAPAKE